MRGEVRGPRAHFSGSVVSLHISRRPPHLARRARFARGTGLADCVAPGEKSPARGFQHSWDPAEAPPRRPSLPCRASPAVPLKVACTAICFMPGKPVAAGTTWRKGNTLWAVLPNRPGDVQFPGRDSLAQQLCANAHSSRYCRTVSAETCRQASRVTVSTVSRHSPLKERAPKDVGRGCRPALRPDQLLLIRTDGFHGFVIRAPQRKVVTAESAVTAELDVGAHKTSTEALATCGAENPVVVSEGTREKQPTRRVQTNAERSLALSEFAEHDNGAFAGCPNNTPQGLPQGAPLHAGTCGPSQNATLLLFARTIDSQAEGQAAEALLKQQLSDADEAGAGPQVAAVAPVAVLSSRPKEGEDPLVILTSPARRPHCTVVNGPGENEVLPNDGGCFEGSADTPGEMQVRKSKDDLDLSASGKEMPVFEDGNTCSRISDGQSERFMNKSRGPRLQP
ncbi:MAG: hypothetical protein BJ554DRAFT_4235, partial [Olpidium bornovanus]